MSSQSVSLAKLKNKLLFVPLGGSGELGKNLNLYHYNGHWIMVDCGSGFGHKSVVPGAELIIPDISFIIDNKIKISALIVTHAHEDHIGGVPYLYDSLKCPVYLTPFAAAFLRTKLKSFTLDSEVNIVEITPNNGIISVGPFKIEIVGITHSIPEMKALVIETEKGKIVHTGDWKFDKNPIVGDPTEEDRLIEIGNSGVLAMMCDSTNAMSHGWSGSELDLEGSLLDIVSGCNNMVIITTFASNIARVATAYKIATETGRTLAIAGTALHRMIAIAQKTGYLLDVEFIDAKDVADMDRTKVLLLATGSQGEELATISKIAHGIHPLISAEAGDTLIFSCKIIPGNEERAYTIMNKLVNLGIEIITEKDRFVHVSGHPNKEELKRMYEIIKPQLAIPIHGESFHLYHHCLLATQDGGVKEAFLAKDGDVLELSQKGGIIKHGTVHADFLAVDGCILRSSDSIVMRQRRLLAKAGIIICTTVFSKSGKIVLSPQITPVGCLDGKEDSDIIKEIESMVGKFISKQNWSDAKSRDKIYSETRAIIKRYMRKNLALEPTIEIINKAV